MSLYPCISVFLSSSLELTCSSLVPQQHPIPLFSPVEEADYVPTPYSHSYLDRADSTTSRQGQGAPNRRPSQHSNYAQHSSYGRLGDDDSEARSPLAGSGVFQAISTRRGSMGGYSDPYNPRQSIAGSSSSGGWKDSKGGRGQQGGGGKESDGEMEMGRRGGRGEGGGRGESQSLMGRNVFVVHHDGGGAPVTVFTDEGTEVSNLLDASCLDLRLQLILLLSLSLLL